jgi:hypothetical protein
MGIRSVGDVCWFTVEWLTSLPKRGSRGLRLFEEDLPTFELVSGPVVIPVPRTTRQERAVRKPPLAQATVLFSMDDNDG